MIAVIRRALAGHDAAADAVAMQQAVAAVDVHLMHVLEIFARQIAVGPRPLERFEQRHLRTIPASPAATQAATICCARMSSGAAGCGVRSKLAALGRPAAAPPPRPVRRSSAETAGPLGIRSHRMARSADALQECRDRARRADLDHQIDVADIDAQLQRRRGDQALAMSPDFSRCSASSRRSRDRLL